MRRCGNGHEIADGDFQFCPICGERLGDDPSVLGESAATAVSGERPGTSPSPAAGSPTTGPPSQAPQSTSPTKRRRWPVSIAWTIVIAFFTALTGLLVLLAIYLWRGGQRTPAVFVGGIFALLVILVLISAVSGGNNDNAAAPVSADSTTAATTTTASRSCATYKGVKPQTCISKTGFACSGYDKTAKPVDCFTPAQRRARAALARARAIAAAKLARRRAAAAAQAAKARAAEVAAANAWHAGYQAQDANVYWKTVSGGSCQSYASHGCWHVAVITRDGCSSYVAVNANEYQGTTIINQLLDNQGFGIPAKTQRLFELDADADGVTMQDVQIDCT
jgi:hypothetical protein